jgi:hypothetical protein
MRMLLVTLVLMWCSDAIAQQGFQDGFLLTPSLDTVRGLVRFSGKVDVPTPCLFKSNRKSPVKEIHPGTVHGFCTDKGAYFYSRSIGKSEDVFIEVLVKGHMNLFKFGDIFFVEKADGAFFELSDEAEIVMVEGQRQQQKSRNYTRMLSLLMADCMEASKKAPTVPLKERQLVNLVTTYNRCQGSGSELFRIKLKK